jgi:hypothetical protein
MRNYCCSIWSRIGGASVKGVADGNSWLTNNKRGSDLYSVEEWGSAFLRLGKSGLIEFYEESFDGDEARLLQPTRDEVMGELTRTAGDCLDQHQPGNTVWAYRLTPAGGAVWEQFARPRWDQYIEWGSECDENGENDRGAARCAAEWPLKRFLAFASQAGLQIDVPSINWREETDWKPRYWKPPVKAHVVEYRILDDRAPEWDAMSWGVYRLLYDWKTKF